MNAPFHYVLLDTNIWVHKSKLLYTPLGTSLLYSLGRTGRKILLPEVVELEVRSNVTSLAIELISQVSAPLHSLRFLLDHPLELAMPDSETIESAVGRRLDELADVVVQTPFTLKQAKNALVRVVEKRPPSVRGQQYKDCAIWEAALEIADTHSICLVTEDKGFFEQKQELSRLSPEMQKEVETKSHQISVFFGLKKYLKQHGVQAPPLPDARLNQILEEEARSSVEWMANGQGLVLDELLELSSTPFLTGDPDDVVYGFSATFRATLRDPDGGEDWAGSARVEGEIVYEPGRDSVDDVELTSIWFYDQSGTRRGGWDRGATSTVRRVETSSPRSIVFKPVNVIRHRLSDDSE
jgi:hypothetical protein